MREAISVRLVDDHSFLHALKIEDELAIVTEGFDFPSFDDEREWSGS